MAQVLLVEDDPELCNLLEGCLTAFNHQVTTTTNGKRAIELLKKTDFDIVVSDFQMPEMDGIKLFQWIRENKKTPFILMSGYADFGGQLPEVTVEMDRVLAKPCRLQDIREALDECLNVGSKDRSKDHEYCKVPINEFIVEADLDFDIFIRLAGNRYVKIGHHGSPPSREQMESYIKKGAQHLYLNKEDLGKLIHFNVQVAKAATQLSLDNVIERNLFLRYTAETILEQTFVVGMNQPAFQSATEFMEIMLSSFENENELLNQLILLDSQTSWIYRHSLAVSIYSIMIARQMRRFSLQQVLLAGLAGMFHDVGKKEFDPGLMEKSPGLLSPQEKATLKTHPTLSRKILEKSPGTQPELLEIVEQHHEQLDGKGYPKGLKGDAIHPLALVVSGANILAKLLLPPRQKVSKLDFDQALAKINADPHHPIAPLVLSAIRELHE